MRTRRARRGDEQECNKRRARGAEEEGGGRADEETAEEEDRREGGAAGEGGAAVAVAAVAVEGEAATGVVAVSASRARLLRGAESGRTKGRSLASGVASIAAVEAEAVVMLFMLSGSMPLTRRISRRTAAASAASLDSISGVRLPQSTMRRCERAALPVAVLEEAGAVEKKARPSTSEAPGDGNSGWGARAETGATAAGGEPSATEGS